MRVPEGVDEAAARKRLLTDFNIEVGAGLGPLKGKIWRIGIMGYSARSENIMLCLGALGSVLKDAGLSVHEGDDEGAAQTVNFGTKDTMEAMRAFIEKRDPQFKGH